LCLTSLPFHLTFAISRHKPDTAYFSVASSCLSRRKRREAWRQFSYANFLCFVSRSASLCSVAEGRTQQVENSSFQIRTKCTVIERVARTREGANSEEGWGTGVGGGGSRGRDWGSRRVNVFTLLLSTANRIVKVPFTHPIKPRFKD